MTETFYQRSLLATQWWHVTPKKKKNPYCRYPARVMLIELSVNLLPFSLLSFIISLFFPVPSTLKPVLWTTCTHTSLRSWRDLKIFLTFLRIGTLPAIFFWGVCIWCGVDSNFCSASFSFVVFHPLSCLRYTRHQ